MLESTTNYKQFKTLYGNRAVNEHHVQELIAAIKHKNLLQYFPVLTNENMEVIDGQHRLEAAERRKLPVWWVSIPGLTLDDVMSINSHSKSWKIQEFVDAFIKIGKPDYKILQDFTDQYSLSLTVGARLLYGDKGYKGLSLSKIVQTGRFVAHHLEYAEMIAQQVNDLKPYCDFDPVKVSPFIDALSIVNRSPNFDFQRFKAKLQMSGRKIESKTQLRFYILHIEDLYNYNTRNYVDLYASSQSTKVYFSKENK